MRANHNALFAMRSISSPLRKAFRFFLISYYENKAQYQQTRLGLAWIPASSTFFVLVLTGVFAHIQSMSAVDYFLYVLSGYCAWMLILETINQSTSTIQGQLDFANHNRVSMVELFIKNVVDRLFRHMLNIGTLYGILLVLAVAGDVRWADIARSLLLYPIVLAFALPTALGTSYIVNSVSLVWPDLEKVIHTSTRFLFFLSPVFWIYNAGETGFRQLLVTWNPVVYWLDVTRQAFGLNELDIRSWIVVAMNMIAVCAIAMFVYRRNAGIIRNIS